MGLDEGGLGPQEEDGEREEDLADEEEVPHQRGQVGHRRPGPLLRGRDHQATSSTSSRMRMGPCFSGLRPVLS